MGSPILLPFFLQEKTSIILSIPQIPFLHLLLLFTRSHLLLIILHLLLSLLLFLLSCLLLLLLLLLTSQGCSPVLLLLLQSRSFLESFPLLHFQTRGDLHLQV